MKKLDSKGGLRGILVNAQTMQRIPFARWANLETGEYEAFYAGPDGKAFLDSLGLPLYPDDQGKPRTVRGRAQLRFIEKGGSL